MIRAKVNSSDISSIGYDNTRFVLEIEFSSGSVYQYFNVPRNTYSSLISANSIGKFFHAEIKNKYEYKKI